MTDTQYRNTYLKRHRSYERMALGEIRKVFEGWRKIMIGYIEEKGLSDVGIAAGILIKPHVLQSAFTKIYSNIGTVEGKTQLIIFNELVTTRKKDFNISFSDAEWRREMVNYMLLHAGSRISGITRVTQEKIQYLLALAQEQNLSVDETVKFLLEQIRSSEFPAFSKNRAMAIARTESTTAANHGAMLAGDRLSILYEKKWVSAQDNRTRRQPRDKFDHLVMNGVKVQPQEDFFVSGEHMKHPGDPTASKGNVVNCRCIVRLTPVYDENGMPVPKDPTMRRFSVVL